MLKLRLPSLILLHRAPMVRSAHRRSVVLQASSTPPQQRLSLIHFNDVYNIDSRTVEPVGGAARLAHLVRRLQAEEGALVLFSGDCLNPSLLSAFTSGSQMVPILNSIGVNAAVVGNHDFDFGVEVLRHRMQGFDFPWLLSNVLDISTGEPLGAALRSTMLTWQGLRIGLVGLVEREWLLTIPSIDAERDIVYIDFIQEGRRLARELLAQGADVVIALTHMRGPNDLALAAAVPEISLILGGHDHDHFAESIAPYGTPVIKSGTDFRELSLVHVELLGKGPHGTEMQRRAQPHKPEELRLHTNNADGFEESTENKSNFAIPAKGTTPSAPRTVACSATDDSNAVRDVAPTPTSSSAEAALRAPLVKITWERFEAHSSVPEDPEVAAIVESYRSFVDARMDAPLGRTFVDLDARFDAVRSCETNIGNLMADVMRLGLGADAAFLNGGTIRSDQIHAAGRLTMRDFVSQLPFLDELVVLRLSGADVVTALETGVSSWPKREGRFLQISGMSFKFDPWLSPGSRVIPGSVNIAGAPVDMSRYYHVATKCYLRSGKDGFDALKRAEVLIDGETAPRLATLVQYLLTRIEKLNDDAGANSEGRLNDAEHAGTSGNHADNGGGAVNRAAHGALQPENTRTQGGMPVVSQESQTTSSSSSRTQLAPRRELEPVTHHITEPCAHGLDVLYFYDVVSGTFGIAPQVEGRIINVAAGKH